MAPKEDFIELSYKRQKEKKTHASFPQLKYPSLRDDGLKSHVQWLTGRAMDDNAEGLWRVHNKIYDLSDFIKKHPGGAEWLELTKGLDITELYECHHLTPYTDTVLEKYFVRDTSAPRNSPFTFENDGFYKTLKREVIEELKTIPKHVAKNADMIIDGLFATLLFTSAFSCWASNYWLVMVSYLAASLSLGWLTIAAHNYIHRRTNWRMYYFNLSMQSFRDFRVSHVLSHHVFPNTLMDMEVTFIEPLVFWNPKKDKPFHAKYLAFPIECALYPFNFVIGFVKRFICNFVHEDFFRKHYRWHDGICFALPLWMYIISGCSITHAVTTWLWVVCTSSFIVSTIGFNAAHHHPEIFKDGDEPKDTKLDWALHQLEAVMDRKDINGSLFKVLTFFGDHALHHLFPTLDHAILPYLYPVFLKNVEKFRGNFRVTSSLDLFLGQIRTTMKTEPTLVKDRKRL